MGTRDSDPYRARDWSRPLGESWIQWAARWCVRGMLGITIPAAVIGLTAGAVIKVVEWIWMPRAYNCQDSVTQIVYHSSVTCDVGQTLSLQLDPVDKDRSLAVCRCNSPAPAASK